MSIRVIVELMGLVVVVPNGASADVIMVDGEAPKHAHLNVGIHQPQLVMDASFLCKEEAGTPLKTTPPKVVLALPDGRRMAVWDIKRNTVSFSPGSVEQTPSLQWLDLERDYSDWQPGTFLTRWTEWAWKDLGWIASVSKAAGDKPINTDYLKPPGVGDVSPTEGLLRMTSGTLSTGLPFAESLREAVWCFRPEPKERKADETVCASESVTHTRALSDHVKWAFDAGDKLEITLTAFPSKAEEEPRKICVGGEYATDVMIAIASLPEPPKKPHPYPSERIPHFKAFYQLLPDDDIPADPPIPVLNKGGKKGYRGVGSSECPPALARRK